MGHKRGNDDAKDAKMKNLSITCDDRKRNVLYFKGALKEYQRSAIGQTHFG